MEPSNNKSAKTEDKVVVPWSDFPFEILELILHCLPISDYPYFSSVCKSWNSVTPTIYPVYRNPLLLQFKTARNNNTLCHCYDPFLNKTFKVDCPVNLSGYNNITYGKEQWLLAHNDSYVKLVNPFTGAFHQYRIMVEQFSTTRAAFCGVPPNDCMIFVIYNLRGLADDDVDTNGVGVCFYDGKGWSYLNFTCNTTFKITPWSDPVFFDNNVYCLGMEGVIGRFTARKNSWEVLEKIQSENFKVDCEDSFLVESREQLLVVQIRDNGKSIGIFRLEQADMTWHEIHCLDDQSLFISTRTISVAPFEEKFKNKVYLPWFYGVFDVIEADLVNSNGQLFFLPKSLPDSNDQGTFERRNTHEIYCYSMEKDWHSGHLAYRLKLHSMWFRHRHP